MGAYRADFRSLGTDNDVSAVAALPNLDFASLEHFGSFNIVKQSTIALFMALFDSCNHPEFRSKLRESLFLCGLGEACVHVCPLVVLAFSRSYKILCCIAYAVELLEPKLRVLLLVVGCLEEQGCNLLEAVFLCLRCEIGVFVSPAKAASRFFSVWVPAYLFAIV